MRRIDQLRVRGNDKRFHLRDLLGRASTVFRQTAMAAVRRFSPAVYCLIKARSLLYDRDSYLIKTGFMKTYLLGFPCDVEGQPIPWMNYDLISFLRRRLSKDLTLFEYGSGYSTLFFSRLVGEVVSVEYDSTWHHMIEGKAPENVSIVFCAKDFDGQYCRAIKRTGKNFDVVIVDGRDRTNCIAQSFDSLTPKGVIVLDDSGREEYRSGADFLLRQGFRAIDFEGLAPNHFEMTRATVFYREGNCLSI